MNKCFCSNLHQADLALTAFYNRYISPTGLTIRQYTLLSYLQSLQPINVTRLALAMNLDRTSLVRNLKPLLAKKSLLIMAEKAAAGV